MYLCALSISVYFLTLVNASQSGLKHGLSHRPTNSPSIQHFRGWKLPDASGGDISNDSDSDLLERKAVDALLKRGQARLTVRAPIKMPPGSPPAPIQVMGAGGDPKNPKDQRGRQAAKKFECKKVADCKCAPSPYGESCFKNECFCGEKNKKIDSVNKGFAKPVMDAMVKVGKALEKVLGPMTLAIKSVIKLGTWLVPGLPVVAKGAAKLLDAAIPPVTLGDKKADEIVDIVNKVL